MDLKKVLIVGAVIGVAYYFYKKSKNGSSTSSNGAETASGINGAQYLYEKGALNATGATAPKQQCQCWNGFAYVPCSCANKTAVPR